MKAFKIKKLRRYIPGNYRGVSSSQLHLKTPSRLKSSKTLNTLNTINTLKTLKTISKPVPSIQSVPSVTSIPSVSRTSKPVTRIPSIPSIPSVPSVPRASKPVTGVSRISMPAISHVLSITNHHRSRLVSNPISKTKSRIPRIRAMASASPSAMMKKMRMASRNPMAGASAVNATGEPIESDPTIPWPEEFKAAFAISMSNRPERWEGLKARFGHWAKHVRYWRATSGFTVNKNRWMNDGKLARGCALRRGEIGCYDSHVRIWKFMTEHKIESALIMEDDANIRHRWDHYKRIRSALDELKKRDKNWDLLYIGMGDRNSKQRIAPDLGKCQGCQGLFAYVLTIQGAQKLLKHAMPFRIPVDVLVGNLSDKKILNTYCMYPRLCYVVPVHSDTAGIK